MQRHLFYKFTQELRELVDVAYNFLNKTTKVP